MNFLRRLPLGSQQGSSLATTPPAWLRTPPNWRSLRKICSMLQGFTPMNLGSRSEDGVPTLMYTEAAGAREGECCAMRIVWLLVLACLALGGVPGQTNNPPPEARKAFERGIEATKSGQVGEARKNFETAVALRPDYAEAWYALGEIQRRQNDPEAARKSLQAALRANPRLVEAQFSLALVEQSAGNWKALADITERLVQLDLSNPAAYVLRATAHLNLGELDAAEKAGRTADRMDLAHKDTNIPVLLGWILDRRGDAAGAAEQFRKYLRLEPNGKRADAVRVKVAELDAHAREMQSGPQSAVTFRADTKLAMVRFQVSPQRGQFVTDLRPEDVEIREDGKPQTIAVFEGGESYRPSVPLEITLLFDCSGSVRLSNSLQPHVFETNLLDKYANVKIAVYAFSNSLTRIISPTRSGPDLEAAMDAVLKEEAGNTPLFLVICETARQAAASGGDAVRMMVIFSDGLANSPDLGHYEAAVGAAQELGIALYPVMLGTEDRNVPLAPTAVPIPVPRPSDYSSLARKRFLSLAEHTGGRRFEFFGSKNVLATVLRDIAEHIRYDYVVGFYPSASDGTGKQHTVEVSLRSKDKGQIIGGKRVVEH
jgi:VWFA-related protein